MAVKPKNNSSPGSEAEQQLDELLRLGRTEPAAYLLDALGDQFDPQRVVRGEFLTRRLLESLEEPGWRPFGSRRAGQQPVIAIEDTIITGEVNLRATELPYLLEFTRCRFDTAPDLRQATLSGLVFTECKLPGMQARNLRVGSDTVLRRCKSTGVLNLADADITGSLTLDDSELENPEGRTIHADRLTIGGALLAQRVKATGQIRIPGADVAGNLNFSGATLENPGQQALNATGIQVGGSMRFDVERGVSFSCTGQLRLASAHIAGDLRMGRAELRPGDQPWNESESTQDDPISTLVLDRAEINGDVRLNHGFHSTGTVRMTNARLGADLRMTSCRIDVGWIGPPAQAIEHPRRALHLDSTQIAGNLMATGAVLHGELRMTDVRVQGSFTLNKAVVYSPRTDAVQASRVTVGSNLDCREADITGSFQLQGGQVGANLDLRATHLTKPAWHRHKMTYKPALDLRGTTIARDLVCAAGSRKFRAEGEIQLRRTSIGRQANFTDCVLGDVASRNAINAFGLFAQELTLLPKEPPQGRVLLRQASCELLADKDVLWQAKGGVDVEGFSYDNFSRPIEPTDKERVQERLEWLRVNSRGRYQPGPYDQLAMVFRSNGCEEHAVMVMIEKQRRRYQAIAAETRPVLRWPVQLWSLLQRVTVSYGFRPVRALTWIVVLTAAGTAWFHHHPLEPINEEDNPVWNPFLYTVDQLVPIINLGHDQMWRATGGSQWITVALIAAGWILATTVAAGITRALRREP